MFDVAPTELMLVAAVALVVIGPKDLPKAMRFVGHWVGKARGVARQFRSGFDTMVREAELEEMEKKWADENARIMREHPPEPASALAAPGIEGEGPVDGMMHVDGTPPEPAAEMPVETPVETPVDTMADPVMVEKPVVAPAPDAPAADAPARDAPAADKTPS